MKVYEPGDLRIIGVIGHGGSGKTTLVSGMLFNAGAVTRFGNVEQGTTITDFDDEEIREFLDKWYKSRLDNETEALRLANDLFKTMGTKKQILELAHNPLLLTIIGIIHRYEAELPEDRLELYDKATESLLYTWDQWRQIIDERFTKNQRRQFLEKVGFSGSAPPGEIIIVGRTGHTQFRAQCFHQKNHFTHFKASPTRGVTKVGFLVGAKSPTEKLAPRPVHPQIT